MKRYWKALVLFWNMSLAAEMEYRLNFVLAMLTSLANLVGSVFGLYLFYHNGTTLGGWSWEQALVVMGLAIFLDGFASTFLRPNIGRLVQHVREGTLDFILLKPMDSQFWLSTRTFSIWGVPNMLYGLAAVVYAGTRLDLGVYAYALGVIPLLIGMTILYGLWFILSTMSIWFVKVYNMTGILRGVLEAARFPVPAYPPVYRFIFTFVVPVAFLTTVPAAAMVEPSAANGLGIAVVLAIILCLASRLFWRFALRFYTSASS